MKIFQKLDCFNAINSCFLGKKISPTFPVTICFHTVETTDKADQDQISVVASFPRSLEVHCERRLCHMNRESLAGERGPEAISKASWVLHI